MLWPVGEQVGQQGFVPDIQTDHAHPCELYRMAEANPFKLSREATSCLLDTVKGHCPG